MTCFLLCIYVETVYKKPDYPALDFRMKPEFTQVLKSRRIVENYNGTLSCSLKSNPRPKIRWFKNKIEIIDNPKYKMTQAMGTLNQVDAMVYVNLFENVCVWDSASLTSINSFVKLICDMFSFDCRYILGRKLSL